MEKRFSGKTVVITGASGGIGVAMAKRFAAEGASVVVSAIDQRVEQVAQDLRNAGAKAVASVMDVTSKSDVGRLYELAEREFGSVDVSIQNAGVITISRIEALTEAEWDKIMAVRAVPGLFESSGLPNQFDL